MYNIYLWFLSPHDFHRHLPSLFVSEPDLKWQGGKDKSCGLAVKWFFFLYCSNPPPPTITFFPLNLSPTTCLDSGGLESNSLRLPVFDLNLTGTHSNSSERDIHRECVCERDRKEIRVIQNWREESWVRVAESHQCMFSVCVCVCGNQNISVLKMKLWKYKKQIMGVPCYYWCTS